MLSNLKPDVAFNCLHGTYGEDGAIQGLLEILRIPYTHSGILSSSISMDKVMTRKIATWCGINMPKSLVVKAVDFLKYGKMALPKEWLSKPYVIKPISEGSTIGVHIVHDHSFVLESWEHGEFILIEEYIPGKELSVAVLRGTSIDMIELKPKSNFYNYEAKYTEGLTEHILPVLDVPKKAMELSFKWAEVIHKELNCRTISRSDFRYNVETNEMFFLEINTHPGFTQLSIVPEIAKFHNISFNNLIEMLIEDAICDLQNKKL